MERENTGTSKRKASGFRVVSEYQGELTFEEALGEVIKAAWDAWIDAPPEDGDKVG